MRMKGRENFMSLPDTTKYPGRTVEPSFLPEIGETSISCTRARAVLEQDTYDDKMEHK